MDSLTQSRHRPHLRAVANDAKHLDQLRNDVAFRTYQAGRPGMPWPAPGHHSRGRLTAEEIVADNLSGRPSWNLSNEYVGLASRHTTAHIDSPVAMLQMETHGDLPIYARGPSKSFII